MEDQPMGATAAAQGLVGSTAKIMPSYLEQLAQELGRYRELLNILDERLSVVSERAPSEPSDNQPESRVHISTMVGIIKRYNRDFDRIINEIAL